MRLRTKSFQVIKCSFCKPVVYNRNGWAEYKPGPSIPKLVDRINTLDLSIPAARAAYNEFWFTPIRSLFCRSEDGYLLPEGKEYSFPVGMKPLSTNDPLKECDSRSTEAPSSGGRSLKAISLVGFSLFVLISVA
eukprot:m.160483 g.160483  ORF g.160483 m.160483 type:complete len:134 (+) comp38775_c1_seq1:1599-2000(+)